MSYRAWKYNTQKVENVLNISTYCSPHHSHPYSKQLLLCFLSALIKAYAGASCETLLHEYVNQSDSNFVRKYH